jgi:hypothetical protein
MLIEAELPLPSQAQPVVVDHVGFVVRDLDHEIARWRDFGFQVSESEALMRVTADAKTEPLGQHSAHVVFDNAYVELSTPVPGSGNHLEPFLEIGEGARIMVFATGDAEVAWTHAASAGLAASTLLTAARQIRIGADISTARFRWFRLQAALWPGVLCAVVEHETPDLVFHPGLIRHANGFCRVSGIAGCGLPASLIGLEFRPVPGRGAPLLRSDTAVDGGLLLAGPAGRPERFFAFRA